MCIYTYTHINYITTLFKHIDNTINNETSI